MAPGEVKPPDCRAMLLYRIPHCCPSFSCAILSSEIYVLSCHLKSVLSCRLKKLFETCCPTHAFWPENYNPKPTVTFPTCVWIVATLIARSHFTQSSKRWRYHEIYHLNLFDWIRYWSHQLAKEISWLPEPGKVSSS